MGVGQLGADHPLERRRKRPAIPAASLSARIARQATIGRPAATSGSASARAAAPSGLWAASRIDGRAPVDRLETAGDP